MSMMTSIVFQPNLYHFPVIVIALKRRYLDMVKPNVNDQLCLTWINWLLVREDQ